MVLHAGFDIGIQNLALCIIDKKAWEQYCDGLNDDPGIRLWQNLNLVGLPEKCQQIIRTGNKRGLSCDKRATWKLESKGLDETHMEYYCGTHKNEWCVPHKQKKIKNLNMRNLKRKAFMELDNIDLFNNVSHIAIESQPKINQQMKMFSAGIEAYFIIRQNIDNPNTALRCIRYSPAKNKLSIYNGPPISTSHIKNPYDKRKYLAQKHTEYLLARAPNILNDHYFPHKKKDDLADAFLHCVLSMK